MGKKDIVSVAINGQDSLCVGANFDVVSVWMYAYFFSNYFFDYYLFSLFVEPSTFARLRPSCPSTEEEPLLTISGSGKADSCADDPSAISFFWA